MALFSCVEGWYNRSWLHSALGYLFPITYETIPSQHIGKARMSQSPTPPLLESLSQIFERHQGRMSDKWEQYFDIYQSELTAIRLAAKPVALLEIGVQNGGSLEIWKSFLPEGSVVVGMDIDPRCAEMAMPEGITIIIADAANPKALAGLPVEFFDIIIDDGSHLPKDVRETFENLSTRLRPGGIYIVEDVHCSYASGYGGGLGRRNSAAEWGKCFVDALNYDHIEPSDCAAAASEMPWFDKINRQVDRVSFYDSIIVIRTKPEPKLSRYSRVLGGSAIHIDTTRIWWSHLTPELRQTVRLTDAARRELAEGGTETPTSPTLASKVEQNSEFSQPLGPASKKPADDLP